MVLETTLFGIVAVIGLYIAVRIIAIVGDIITSVITLIGLALGLLYIADLLGLVTVFDLTLNSFGMIVRMTP